MKLFLHIVSFIFLSSIIILFLLDSCNEGLVPPDKITKSYLNGIITYKNSKDGWPAKDSTYAIRVVAFKSYPPGNIIEEIQTGNAYLTLNSLPLFVDSSSFSLEIPNPPIELKYIVIALQYDSSFFAQKAVGVFTTSGDKTKPSSIIIEGGKTYNINIDVDFTDLPPQPF